MFWQAKFNWIICVFLLNYLWNLCNLREYHRVLIYVIVTFHPPADCRPTTPSSCRSWRGTPTTCVLCTCSRRVWACWRAWRWAPWARRRCCRRAWPPTSPTSPAWSTAPPTRPRATPRPWRLTGCRAPPTDTGEGWRNSLRRITWASTRIQGFLKDPEAV